MDKRLRELGKKITEQMCNRLAIKLTKYDVITATASLIRSVENGWTGVFPETTRKKPSQSGRTGYHGEYANVKSRRFSKGGTQ